MRKILLSFLILLTTALLCNAPAITAYADTLPKPSLKIEVIGLVGEYYLDLLVDNALNTLYSDEVYSQLNVEFVEYADALRTFRDPNSHHYWKLDGGLPMINGQNLGLTDADSVNFGYMVPTSFQIVIIKENKDIIITGEATRMQFNSNMVLDLTNHVSLVDGETNIYEFTGNVVEVDAIKESILGFLYRLFITLAVELLIAIFIFKVTKKQAIIIIIIVNILTQIMLNAILLNFTSHTLNPIIDFASIFFSLELFIIGLEMLTCRFLIKGYSPVKLLFYGFVANFVTALLTFVV